MEDNIYNSLEERLIQSGIIKQGNEQENMFEIAQNDTAQNDIAQNDFVEIPDDFQKFNPLNKKRLNEYDLNLLKEKIENDTPRSIKTVQRFLNSKEKSVAGKKIISFEKLYFKFFPKIYKAKIAKEALKKLGELNIDTKLLHDKTIPYGEEELHYKNLIKYLNFANEIQNSVKRKCD